MLNPEGVDVCTGHGRSEDWEIEANRIRFGFSRVGLPLDVALGVNLPARLGAWDCPHVCEIFTGRGRGWFDLPTFRRQISASGIYR